MRKRDLTYEELLAQNETLKTHLNVLENQLSENVCMVPRCTLLKHNPDIVAIADSNGIFQYISPNINTIFEWSSDELEGLSILEIAHPKDVALLKKSLDKILLETNSSVKLEYRLKNKSGQYISVQFVAQNFTDTPHINGILIHFHDITGATKIRLKQQKAKDRYQLLSENANHIICLINNQGTIKYLNTYGLNFFNTTRNKVIGENINSFIKPDEFIKYQGQIKQLEDGDLTKFKTVISIQSNADDSTKHIEIIASPVYVNSQRNGEILLSGYNVTDKLLAERKLNDS